MENCKDLKKFKSLEKFQSVCQAVLLEQELESRQGEELLYSFKSVSLSELSNNTFMNRSVLVFDCPVHGSESVFRLGYRRERVQ